jgi:hypothetical protein
VLAIPLSFLTSCSFSGLYLRPFSGESIWDHPCDEVSVHLYLPEKLNSCLTISSTLPFLCAHRFAVGSLVQHYRKLAKEEKGRKAARAVKAARSPDGSPARPKQPQSDQFMRVWGDL